MTLSQAVQSAPACEEHRCRTHEPAPGRGCPTANANALNCPACAQSIADRVLVAARDNPERYLRAALEAWTSDEASKRGDE